MRLKARRTKTVTQRSAVMQSIVLGLILNVGGNIVNFLVELFFGRTDDWLSHYPRVWQYQRWFTASMLRRLALRLVLPARRLGVSNR